MNAISVVVVVLSYLLGSLSFAVIVSRCLDMPDPRSYGSGNPGATNVLRTGKRKAAVLTLLGDALKGLVAVSLAGYVQRQYGLASWLVPAAALAVLIGHMWPVFFRFKGGKGVATALGALLAMNGYIALVALLVWLVVMVLSRISSLSALLAAVSVPVTAYFLYGVDSPYFWGCVAMMLLVVARHHRNIANLLAARESKVGS